MIEVRELTKRYSATVAVDGLSFSVRPGRVTGFLGPNGAARTVWTIRWGRASWSAVETSATTTTPSRPA